MWRRAMVRRSRDSTSRDIDGLSGLWNVNVGHGRKQLGEAARAQMGAGAFSSAYAGGTNEPAIELADAGCRGFPVRASRKAH